MRGSKIPNKAAAAAQQVYLAASASSKLGSKPRPARDLSKKAPRPGSALVLAADSKEKSKNKVTILPYHHRRCRESRISQLSLPVC
jgi:hypothetical protein